MFDLIELGIEFFEGLTAIDRAIVERAAQQPCRDCGGPLHRGDYPRKPRGGRIAAAAEVFSRRFSLCCGREGAATGQRRRRCGSSAGACTSGPWSSWAARSC